MEAVTTWFGAFVLDGTRVANAFVAPNNAGAILARMRLRRMGDLTPEERTLLAAYPPAGLTTRDRRLSAQGFKFDVRARGRVDPSVGGVSNLLLRECLLEDAERALRESWDPSVHIEEAVRARAELDDLLNLVGERLVSWTSRDSPEVNGIDSELARQIAERETPRESERTLPGPEPELLRARRDLAVLFQTAQATRKALEAAIDQAVPRRAPNLEALLGAQLTARMLSKAGGLDRLARLPASTVQVLGAERAFFEHLRGRAPPPRHGLLFQHPQIQTAPRTQRGKLARALAGKVAIAARIDSQGMPVNPSLVQTFERRVRDIRASSPSPKKRESRKRRPKLST
jgi:nucleolar protein 56